MGLGTVGKPGSLELPFAFDEGDPEGLALSHPAPNFMPNIVKRTRDTVFPDFYSLGFNFAKRELQENTYLQNDS
jgi:hypothetical protein